MKRLLFILSSLLLLVLIYPTCRDIWLICWNNEDYSHGLILPLVSAYLIWTDRKKLFDSWRAAANPPFSNLSASLSALFLLVFGLLLLCAGAITQILFISWFAVFPILIGHVALALGWRGARPLIAPILLLFMAKPIPDSVVPLLFFPLQVLAAQGGAWVLEQLSVPVYLVGNIIEIPGMRLMVEEACSGIRSLMALLTVACIVILIVPMKLWARIFIVVVSIVTAIALNVFRVALTGVLAHFYDPKAATGFFHEFSGLVVFGVGLLIVYGLAGAVGRKGASAGGDAPTVKFFVPELSMPGVKAGSVALLIAASAGMFLDMRLAGGSAVTVSVEKFPHQIDGWSGDDGQAMELSSRETLQLDGYIRRIYSREGDKPTFIYIGYWAHQGGEHQAAKHSPMMCLPANGWKVTNLSPIQLSTPGGKPVQVSRVVGQFDNKYTVVYYFFFNGSQYYIREWEALIRIASSALLGRRTDGGIVEISEEITSAEAQQLQREGRLEGTERFLTPALAALDELLISAEQKNR